MRMLDPAVRVRLATGLCLAALLSLALTAPSGAAGTRPSTRSRPSLPAAVRLHPNATLNSVGSRYVRAPIPIKGYTSGLGAGQHRLVLQRRTTITHRWVNVVAKRVFEGGFRFRSQYRSVPGRFRFRTVLFSAGTPVNVSNVIVVTVVAIPKPTCANNPSPATCPPPQPITEQQEVDQPYCPQLVVATHVETRTINWRWDFPTARWVQDPTPWSLVAGSEGQRSAGFADCVKPVSAVPANAVLPDLRIRDLTKCGLGDSQATGGTCFLIDPSAPFNPDFPGLAGEKLLKFGVITMNVGAGPAEIIAARSSASATDWTAYQNFYDATGNLVGSVPDPGVQFYFAGDGHNHWHIRDFDNYDLLDATGTVVARAEKHGYCIQDNTTYQPMQGQPGVPTDPIYTEATSCGKGLTDALTIVHGLSSGWGDTYPTSLPDQAIDITGLPDGVYTVRVHSDGVGAVTEANDNNNVAQIQVQITGNTVTVVPGSSSGGLP